MLLLLIQRPCGVPTITVLKVKNGTDNLTLNQLVGSLFFFSRLVHIRTDWITFLIWDHVNQNVARCRAPHQCVNLMQITF